MKSYSIDKFIEFVIDLVNEDPIFMEREIDSTYYFMHGGCYELYKIVKNYFPQVQCMIENSFEHCAIGYEGKIFDATGIRQDVSNFQVATEEDIEYMDNRFGLNLKNLEVSKIIQEINECNIQDKLY